MGLLATITSTDTIWPMLLLNGPDNIFVAFPPRSLTLGVVPNCHC